MTTRVDVGLADDEVERLAAVARRLDAIAGGLQDAALELAHRELVVDHEHLRRALFGA